MSKKHICLVVTLLFSAAVFAQETKNLQESFLEAEYFLLTYQKQYACHPQTINSNLLLNRGTLYSSKTN